MSSDVIVTRDVSLSAMKPPPLNCTSRKPSTCRPGSAGKITRTRNWLAEKQVRLGNFQQQLPWRLRVNSRLRIEHRRRNFHAASAHGNQKIRDREPSRNRRRDLMDKFT